MKMELKLALSFFLLVRGSCLRNLIFWISAVVLIMGQLIYFLLNVKPRFQIYLLDNKYSSVALKEHLNLAYLSIMLLEVEVLLYKFSAFILLCRLSKAHNGYIIHIYLPALSWLLRYWSSKPIMNIIERTKKF